eukprot:496936-Prymnesium_polylepis.2
MRARACGAVRPGGDLARAARRRDGSNEKTFRVLVRFSTALVVVPFLVLALSYLFVIDRLFTVESKADRMMCASLGARPTCSPRTPLASAQDRAARPGGGPNLHCRVASRYAGIVAICAVQLVVIAFLVYAFNETDEPSEPSAAAEHKKDL